MLFLAFRLNGFARLSIAGERMRSLIGVTAIATVLVVPTAALARSNGGHEPIALIAASELCSAASGITGVRTMAKAKSLELVEVRDTELGKCTKVREAGRKTIAFVDPQEPVLQIWSRP